MMRNQIQHILKITLILAMAALILPSMSAVADEGICRVIDLKLDDTGRIEVIGDRELDYRFFPLSEPERLVFDFKHSRLDYNNGRLDEQVLNCEDIRAVRISQFTLNPDIVRLVIEPTSDKPARITRTEEGKQLTVDFGESIDPVPVDEKEKADTAEPADTEAAPEPEPAPAVEEEIEPCIIEEPQPAAPPEVAEPAGPPPAPAPVVIAPPPVVPFKVFSTSDGVAVDVRDMPRESVKVKSKRRPDRIVIDTGEVYGKTEPVSLGKISIASGPVAAYETLSYGDEYRLVLYVDKGANYREEALPDGVRVVVAPEIANPIKVLASSDETEVKEGKFVFEIGDKETGGGLKDEQETVIEEITAEVIVVPASMAAPEVAVPKMLPLIAPAPRMPGGQHGVDYSLLVGEMVAIPTFGLLRVSVGNPQVITVNVLSQEEILVTALAQGQSALMTWEANGVKQVKWIEVKANVELQAKQLDEIIGEANVTSNIVGETVILEGSVATDPEKSRAEQIATSFGTNVVNLIEVLDPKQVMVKVRVVEIDKKAIEDYFKQISASVRNEDGDFTFSFVSALLDPELPGGGLLDANIRPGIFRGDVGDIRYDPIDTVLDYLETERKANILSEPNLLALHGADAKFRVGGEIPYTYQNEQGVNVVEFKEFGVELNMKPIINPNDTIRLAVNPIVRTVDLSLAIGGIPGFRTREMTTEVQLNSGATMVLGGLIQSEITTVIAKVPLLGDLPILGELFRSEKFQNDQTELLIFITPIVLEGGENLQEFTTGGMEPDEREALFD